MNEPNIQGPHNVQYNLIKQISNTNKTIRITNLVHYLNYIKDVVTNSHDIVQF